MREINQQSREINSSRNVLVGAFNQVVILVLSLFAKSIFIKTLGPVFMGLNGLFTNIFMLLSFAEFGIESVMIYSLYKPFAQHSQEEITKVYHFFRKIYLSLALIIALIGLGVIPFLTTIVNTEVPIAHLSFTYLLFLLGITLANVFQYKANIIIADQKAYIVSLHLLVAEVSSILLQMVVLYLTKSYIYYLVVFILKNLLYGLAIRHQVNKLYPFLNQIKQYPPIKKEEQKEIFQKISDVFGYKFARSFINGTDNILISMIVGTVWVGYYSNYDLIIAGVFSLVTVFYQAISASVGNLIASEDINYQYRIFEIIQNLNLWIAGFTSTALYILFQDFIRLWLGAEYLIDFKLVIIIIINYYLVANRKAISIFREASGMFNKIKYAVFLGAILNIGFSIILGYSFGLAGILIGTIISTLSTYYWYEAKLLMEDKFESKLSVFMKYQIEGAIYTVLSIMLTSLAVSLLPTGTVGLFIVKGGVTLIVSNLFYWFVLSRKKGMQQMIKKMVHNFYAMIVQVRT